MVTQDAKLIELGKRVAELSVPYAHALAEYDRVQSVENWREVDRTLARWRAAVREFDNYEAALRARDNGADPGF